MTLEVYPPNSKCLLLIILCIGQQMEKLKSAIFPLQNFLNKK